MVNKDNINIAIHKSTDEIAINKVNKLRRDNFNIILYILDYI